MVQEIRSFNDCLFVALQCHIKCSCTLLDQDEQKYKVDSSWLDLNTMKNRRKKSFQSKGVQNAKQTYVFSQRENWMAQPIINNKYKCGILAREQGASFIWFDVHEIILIK